MKRSLVGSQDSIKSWFAAIAKYCCLFTDAESAPLAIPDFPTSTFSFSPKISLPSSTLCDRKFSIASKCTIGNTNKQKKTNKNWYNNDCDFKLVLLYLINFRQEYAKDYKKTSSNSWTLGKIRQKLTESWEKVSRELIISSFQKTSFRSDDKFLELSNPNFWSDLKTGISFRKFVTFDDELSNEPSPDALNHQIISQVFYDLRYSWTVPSDTRLIDF